MELKEFIKAAITDISEAISELQAELGPNTIVSPPMPTPIALRTLKIDNKDRLISNIDFNVAVTTGEVDSVEGNAGAGVLQVFSAKVNAGNESKSEKVSRISFSIPVIFPTAKIKTDRDLDDERKKENLRAYREKAKSASFPSPPSDPI